MPIFIVISFAIVMLFHCSCIDCVYTAMHCLFFLVRGNCKLLSTEYDESHKVCLSMIKRRFPLFAAILVRLHINSLHCILIVLLTSPEFERNPGTDFKLVGEVCGDFSSLPLGSPLWLQTAGIAPQRDVRRLADVSASV